MTKTRLQRILLVSILVIVSTFHASTVSAGADNWISRGPNGGSGYVIAVDPVTPTTLYTGTLGGGIFKSVDGAANWVIVNNGLPSLFIISLAIDPITPTTLYAGVSGDGLYKSTNGGESWQPKNSGLYGTHADAIAIDPLNPKNIYIATNSIISKSTNGGEN
jgi:hypothetical protein